MRKPHGYWTRERCAIEASKYSCATDFAKGSSAAADSARRNGWFADITSHFTPKKKPVGYWTKERCCAAAKECRTVSEFRRKFPGGSRTAIKNGWHDEITTHFVSPKKPMGYWTKEKCEQVAERFTCATDFVMHEPVAYQSARDRGWLVDITSHFVPKNSNRTRIVYEIADHDRKIVYVGLTYNLNRRRSSHASSKRIVDNFGINFEITPLTDIISAKEAAEEENHFVNRYKLMGYRVLNKAKPGGLGGGSIKWTKQKCRDEALKYATRAEFQRNSGGCYATCSQRGWIDEVCSHMPKPMKWTKVKCKDEADKYVDLLRFMKERSGVYAAMVRNGWREELTSHMVRKQKPNGYWNKERCHTEALKYQTRSEFKSAKGVVYAIALRDGFVDEICSHMVSPYVKKGHWCLENVNTEAKKVRYSHIVCSRKFGCL